jgi:hypothetical protein
MSDSFKPLSAGLGTLFTDLERRVQAHADLAALVRNTLPGPEKDHVVSAAYRDDTLVILADSAVWCPQIRYAQEALLAALAQAGETRFTKVKVRVGKKVTRD